VAGVAFILGGGDLLDIAAVFAILESWAVATSPTRPRPRRSRQHAGGVCCRWRPAGRPHGAAPAAQGARVDFWPKVRVHPRAFR
jgi:hypothetical protein